MSNGHATTSSNSTYPDLGHYMSHQAHFLISEEDTLVLFLEVIFDIFVCFFDITPSVHPFCSLSLPSCQLPRSLYLDQHSSFLILTLSSCGLFLLLSPSQNSDFLKSCCHLHWTFERPLNPARGFSSSTSRAVLWVGCFHVLNTHHTPAYLWTP